MKRTLLTSVVTIAFSCVTPGQVRAAETTSLAELGAMRHLVSAGLGADDERYHARAEVEIGPAAHLKAER